ncbi:hypothetical protein ACERJO_09660 [Halalkalibacter sp. AB-rgal2]
MERESEKYVILEELTKMVQKVEDVISEYDQKVYLQHGEFGRFLIF